MPIMPVNSDTDLAVARDAYLTLTQDALLGRFSPATEFLPIPPVSLKFRAVAAALKQRGIALGTWHSQNTADVEAGLAWPRQATTMIGRPRLNNVRACVEDAIRAETPGDLIETGAWRGGASIYMRAILQAWNTTDRTVWVADSFEGLPPPDVANYPADATAYPWHEQNATLAVSLDQVRANFESFRLLDRQVKFLKGWFKDTLPRLSDQTWAVIRLDGDLYESTIQALECLYPNLSPGGWLLIDDYNWVPQCKQAVSDYRENHGITAPIKTVDASGAYWQRPR